VRCSRDIDPWCAFATVGAAPPPMPDCPIASAGNSSSSCDALRLLGGQLVEPRREPLGEPSRVGEHDRGPVGAHQLQEPALHGGPDRGPLRGACRRTDHLLVGAARRGRSSERGEIGHRHLDRHLNGLRRARLHDLDRAGAREEGGHLVERPDGGRQADALRGPLQQLVEPLQREGQVGAALRARDACTSSRITVVTPRSDSRAAEVSSRNSDSGVVTSTSGGVRANWRRSSAGVSPVRMPTVTSGTGSPSRCAACRMPASGERRLRWTSTASALSGET
jgi:hypothetical protein